jgi:transketolase
MQPIAPGGCKASSPGSVIGRGNRSTIAATRVLALLAFRFARSGAALPEGAQAPPAGAKRGSVTAEVRELHLIPKSELDRVRDAEVEQDARLALLADMCRLNALVAVKRAGSGHLGSTFSALDLVVHLLYERLNTATVGWEDPERDVFFSSKGHDVPGLYAVLYGLGVIPREKLLALRRLGGLDGHPDVHTNGIEANSGSLGMGISKGRGTAWAKWNFGRGGRVVVLTGDGELQEGQNWEALQAAAHDRVAHLTVVVDRNELQSDKPTEEILALGDLESKLRAFGWHVASCDGHDHAALRAAFDEFEAVEDRPQALVAHTIKGKGVSFMEHSAALAEGGGFYRWHAGAPGDDDFERARSELEERIGERLEQVGLDPLLLEPADGAPEEPPQSLEAEPASGAGAPLQPKVSDEYVVEAYGEALVELAGSHDHLVVLDADLASDCRVRAFELAFPDRFVECGIAEQDMVSTASAIARQGFLPVVNSFAAFLASRANEQIYNQASEGTKVVYALHYAGLIPAGPGKSHQSLRDVSLLGALPNVTIVQPANAVETQALLRWAVDDAEESVAIRLAIGPSPRRIELDPEYRVEPGRGSVLRTGSDGLLVSYGPVMLHEALRGSELLAGRGTGIAVASLPWLNRVDRPWLSELVSPFREVFVVEDHAPVGALGDLLRRELDGVRVTVFGVEGWPACGTPQEALRFHGLDGASLAERIELVLGERC